MDTVLEQQRRLHEERERIEDGIMKEKMLKKNTVRERINCEHRMSHLLDRSIGCATKLISLYEDKDGLRQEEIAAMSGTDEFAEFYRKLKHIRDHHKKYADDTEEPLEMEFLRLDEERKNPPEELQNMVHFTDEEGYGKFLDLHEVYDQFLNLKQMEKLDYLTYLKTFDHLFEIPKEKKNTEYKRYLESLADYLLSYLEKTQPLLDPEALLNQIKKDFSEKWNRGNFPGWKKDTGSVMIHTGASLDLSAFFSPEELMSLGLDRLKSALQALGLKCGGTLEERAQRLFSTKGMSLDQMDPALKAKTKQGKELDEKQEEIALLEAKVYAYIELLGEQRASTYENVERRMARTADELQEEEEEEEEPQPESESEDEDAVPYNPKNLPLGWDGKPIPYWLYKLHGLNVSYTCEICGNATYRGPKAFQRHFSEWRHAHGMRCLGIPNTAHFANITLIADALALWEKIKTLKVRERWLAENEEEFEDSIGNVVNKKTYQDLRRQGLL